MPASKSIGNPQITDLASAQFWIQRLVNEIDALKGLRGTPTFHADVNLGGNRLTNAAQATHPGDVITKSQLDSHVQTLTQSQDITQSGLQVALAALHKTLTNETAQTVNLAVAARLPAGSIVLWHLTTAIPAGWHRCDGTVGTPVVADYGGLPFIMKL